MVKSENGREVLAIALIIHEKEELILDERTGEITSELIESQRLFRYGRRVLEVIFCIQRVIAEKLKQLAVVCVASGFRDDVHLRTERTTVVGTVPAVSEVDLLDAVQAGP